MINYLAHLLQHFFSPKGRYKRLTFWEGIVAWVLLNTVVMMLETLFLSMPFDYWFGIYLGDTEHVFYSFAYMSMFFVHWVIAIWMLAAICAKRWQDLNYPGWLASINTLPLLVLGITFLSFLGPLGRDMIHPLTITPDPAHGVFAIYNAAKQDFMVHVFWQDILQIVFFAALVAASYVCVGFLKGTPGSNRYGKSAA